MKRIYLVVIYTILVLILSSCSNVNNGIKVNRDTKYEIYPYHKTLDNDYLEQTLELTNKAIVFAFKVPGDVMSIEIKEYILNKDLKWKIKHSLVSNSVNYSSKNNDILEGALALVFNQENNIDSFKLIMGNKNKIESSRSFNYNDVNIGLDKTKGIISSNQFIDSFAKIELDEEIPLGIITYNEGTFLPDYSIKDFNDTSKFKDIAFVQAITITFSKVKR